MKWFNNIQTNLTPKEMPEVEEYQLKDREIEKLSASFVSKDEKYIASLGNGYIMNYLTNKSVEKGFAFITDKRVYFKGSCLSGTGKSLVKTNEERTVDIKNITGSGFIYQRRLGILIGTLVPIIAAMAGSLYFLFKILFWLPNFLTGVNSIWSIFEYLFSLVAIVALAIPFCIVFKNYLLNRKTLFRIEYAGGCIAFDVTFYAKTEIDDFQKQLRRTKDIADENVSIKLLTPQVPTESQTQNSNADDLRKYAELLKDGLITQEEYDAMKKKVLGL